MSNTKMLRCTHFLELVLLSLVIPKLSQARSTGAPCSVEYTMTPDSNYHGGSQRFNDTHPPPFSFDVFDPDGIATSTFKRGLIYTIHLQSNEITKPIKGFQLQARFGTSLGDVGFFAAGHFIPSADWGAQGIKMQDCQRDQTTCVTHNRAVARHHVYVQWQTHESEGPIQFVITIVSSLRVFWTNWRPVNGLLQPSTGLGTEPEVSKPRLFFGNFVEDNVLDSVRQGQLIKPRSRCDPSPCANNATCDKDIGFLCFCEEGFQGQFCHMPDYCIDEPCQNGGYCVFDEEQGYKCECSGPYSGRNCEADCPPYLCENGGTCNVDSRGNYRCLCNPNYYGDRCEYEDNKCVSSPCQNGGTCTKDGDDFTCSCTTAYTGYKCQRPCRDIYGACLQWSYERDCPTSRLLTDFFDINCAVTCGQCLPEENKKWPGPPLPQALEVYGFLLGSWQLVTRTKRRVPLGFTKSGIYEERLDFMVTRAPMFGNPSINFTARAVNLFDRSDVQEQQGYLSLEQRSWPNYHLSFMTVDNNGVILYEDGRYREGEEFELVSQRILNTNPDLAAQIPETIRRKFILNKKQNLEIDVQMLQKDGNLDIFTLEYVKLLIL